jgi:uncharacterized membrane protein YheB (UPF0754 family)
MITDSVIVVPLLGAFIGWLTNKIALWMLYHPERAYGPGWFAWQGLIPRRKEELARAIARTVTDKLLTEDDLSDMLRRLNLRVYLREVTDSLIERRLTGTIHGYQFMPHSVRNRLVAAVKEIVAEHLPERIDDVSPDLTTRLIADLDVGRHLEQRITDWPIEEVERVTKAVAGREMRGIEMVGAVLGFLIGAAQTVISFL